MGAEDNRPDGLPRIARGWFVTFRKVRRYRYSHAPHAGGCFGTCRPLTGGRRRLPRMRGGVVRRQCVRAMAGRPCPYVAGQAGEPARALRDALTRFASDSQKVAGRHSTSLRHRSPSCVTSGGASLAHAIAVRSSTRRRVPPRGLFRQRAPKPGMPKATRRRPRSLAQDSRFPFPIPGRRTSEHFQSFPRAQRARLQPSREAATRAGPRRPGLVRTRPSTPGMSSQTVLRLPLP